MNKIGALLALGLILAATGCAPEVFVSTTFPDAVVDADGDELSLEVILEIVEDFGLTDDQKRQQLEALGIEDPDLIDALLGLGL